MVTKCQRPEQRVNPLQCISRRQLNHAFRATERGAPGRKKKQPSRHFLPVLHVLSVERDVREHSLKIMLQLRVLTHPRWPYRAISSLQTKAGCTARFIVYIISLKEKKKLSFEPFVCFNLIPPPPHTHTKFLFFFRTQAANFVFVCFCIAHDCTCNSANPTMSTILPSQMFPL